MTMSDRQLVQYTTTAVLDELIAADPRQLAYYRTRAIVHAARDEYTPAIRDFTYALHEVRVSRSTKTPPVDRTAKNTKKGKKETHHRHHKSESGAHRDSSTETESHALVKQHPSTLPHAPQALELQLVFFRGVAQLHHALCIIEEAVWKLERVPKVPSTDGPDMRLSYIPGGKYGGIEIGNAAGGLLGPRNAAKFKAYRQLLNPPQFQEEVHAALRKSLKDHERFISHFDSFEYLSQDGVSTLAQRAEAAYIIADAHRPGQDSTPSPKGSDSAGPYMTYHPFVAEAHFAQVICHLLLGDMQMMLVALERAARVVDALDGAPIFANSRSLVHADFMEVLERLARSWENGIKPHDQSRQQKDTLSAVTKTLNGLGFRSPSSSTGVSEDHESASSSSSQTPISTSASLPSHRNLATSLAPSSETVPNDLGCLRILLNAVLKRQKVRVQEKKEEERRRAAGHEKTRFSICLHGPKVDVALTWLAAVIIPDLERGEIS